MSHTLPLPAVGKSPQTRSSSQLHGVLAALLLQGLAVALATVYVSGGLSQSVMTVALLVWGVLALALIALDVRYGLVLFLVSSALSPELQRIAENVKLSDFVMLLTVLVWGVRCLRAQRLPRLDRPLVLPMVVYTLLSTAMTIIGHTFDYLVEPQLAPWIILKRLEYLLVFLVVVDTVRTRQWIRLLIFLFVATAAATALYGMVTQQADIHLAAADVAQTRVVGPAGENPNTLSGFLAIAAAVTLGALLQCRKPQVTMLLGLALALLLICQILTYSREGYLMMAVVFATVGPLWFRVGVLLLALLAGPMLMPQSARMRLHETAQMIREVRTGDVGTNSLAFRVQGWRYYWERAMRHRPLLGSGVGSSGLGIDNEYILRVMETGVVGLFVFLWLLYSKWGIVRRLRRLRGDPLARALATGLTGSLLALMLQALVATSFTTIRTMEPLFFLLGLGYAVFLIARRAPRSEAGA